MRFIAMFLVLFFTSGTMGYECSQRPIEEMRYWDIVINHPEQYTFCSRSSLALSTSKVAFCGRLKIAVYDQLIRYQCLHSKDSITLEQFLIDNNIKKELLFRKK